MIAQPNASTTHTTAHVDVHGVKHYGIAARMVADREARGLLNPFDARKMLCHLGIDARYTFVQISLMLRSGRGDER